MESQAKIYVAGHRGLVGSAIVRRLQADGFHNLLLRTHAELDLTRQADVEQFFASERPEYVFLAAARVGGIHANNHYRAEFIGANLAIQGNVIDAAYRHGCKRLMFLGSSCIYPKHCPQPMKEEYLLTGPLEPTNEPYAIAKIAGIKLCEAYNDQYGTDFVSVMPTNLYGPNDNFSLEDSHVLPALMRKFHEAKRSGAGQVEVWGSGTPRREFLHVDDMADACLFVMRQTGFTQMLNIGTGSDVSIAELAGLMAKVVGFDGELLFDRSRPDGTPRKLQDVTRLAQLGWRAGISLEQGVAQTYQWFVENERNLRR